MEARIESILSSEKCWIRAVWRIVCLLLNSSDRLLVSRLG